MSKGLAFVNIDALFGIVRIDNVASIAKTEISSARQIIASMLTASTRAFDLVLAFSFLVASSFVGVVSAVVAQVADLAAVHAVAVGALEIREDVGAASRSVGAQSHIVFIASVSAVVLAVAHVVPRDALEVVALVLVHFVAREASAEVFGFVTSVAAVITAIAEVVVVDAKVIAALELVLGAVFAVGEPRLAAELVAEVETISFAIAAKFFFDTVS